MPGKITHDKKAFLCDFVLVQVLPLGCWLLLHFRPRVLSLSIRLHRLHTCMQIDKIDKIDTCAKLSLLANSHGGSPLCPQTLLLLLFFFLFIVFLAVLHFSSPLAPHTPLVDPRFFRIHSSMAGRPQRPDCPLVPGPARIPGHGCFRIRTLSILSLFGIRLRWSSGSQPLAYLPVFQGLEVRVRVGSEAQGECLNGS